VLKLPDNLTAETFLDLHWQKQPLYMPAALGRVNPSITRNELGWLATLDDVESRLVFVDRDARGTRYRAETGPFSVTYLQDLPKRDWTLLVHDVEKHLPAFRALLDNVPFVPDWRIDDLMVSFAAPGGGVGPHRDNYDVFLCQGVGVRNWRFTGENIDDDPDASEDLALLREFEGTDDKTLTNGDVLYLPPGVAHWGVAKRACITYSIGMRAPGLADLADSLNIRSTAPNTFYRDPDLKEVEARSGFISSESVRRAIDTLALTHSGNNDVARALGKFATLPKDSLMPDGATAKEVASLVEFVNSGGNLLVHGMALLAFDDRNLYVNGSSTELPEDAFRLIEDICTKRSLSLPSTLNVGQIELIAWMLWHGAFEISVDC
jgi:50S ribosomal protein L16 3-hydroxylase